MRQNKIFSNFKEQIFQMVLEEYDNQHDDIPDPLKRLSKLILRAFYAYDHCLGKSNLK